MDIVISLKNRGIYAWRIKLKQAFRKDLSLNYRLQGKPVRLYGSNKVYICYKRKIIGYFKIDKILSIKKPFKSQFTGELKPAGIYLFMKARTWTEYDKSLKYKQVQGFSYLIPEEVEWK